MRADQFAKHYPHLYHMAEVDAFEGILRHGLLSTSALLDLFGMSGTERYDIESCRRPNSVIIEHPKYGKATIRDQKPICDIKLEKSLIDCTPEDWYKLLNGKVFFWISQEKLQNLLSARTYRNKSHIILIVDSLGLVNACFSSIFLSPINSGAMPYGPTPRGLSTFVSISDWPDLERPRAGGLKRPVVELAVNHSIPNVFNFILRVEKWVSGSLRKIVWKP